MLLACPLATAAPFVYIAQPNNGTIAVVDAANNSITGSIAVSDSSIALAITHSGAKAYVALAQSRAICRVDLADKRVEATLPMTGVPIALVLDKDDSRLFVANSGDASTLTVIDAATFSVAATVALPDKPWALALAPTGSRLYTLFAPAAAIVGVVDISTSSYHVLPNLSNRPDLWPSGFAVNADGTKIYVANWAYISGFDPPPGSDVVTVIDTSAATAVRSISVGDQVTDVSLDAQTGDAYVAAYAHVAVIDAQRQAVKASVAVTAGSSGVVFEPVRRRLYVPNYRGDLVTVIDPSTSSVLTTLAISGPGAIAVAPAALGAATTVGAVPMLSSALQIALALALALVGTMPAARRRLWPYAQMRRTG